MRKQQPKPFSHSGHLSQKGVTISRGSLEPTPACKPAGIKVSFRAMLGIKAVEDAAAGFGFVDGAWMAGGGDLSAPP